MSVTWEFIKRHQGKIILGGVTLAGALGAYSASQHRESCHAETSHEEKSEEQGSKHYIYDIHHATCDVNILKMANELRNLTEKRFELDSLVLKIRNDELNLSVEEKIKIWNEIKRNSFARLSALAFSYSILTVTLKCQTSMIAALTRSEMTQARRNQSTWNEYLPGSLKNIFGQKKKECTEQAKSIFLQCIKFFTISGVHKLFDIVEEAALHACEKIQLDAKYNNESVRVLFDNIDQEVVEVLRQEMGNLIAPMSAEDASANPDIISLLQILVNALNTSECFETIAALLDFYYSAACQKLQNDTAPMARLIPHITDSFNAVGSDSYDGPLRNSLCCSQLHVFSKQIFNRNL